MQRLAARSGKLGLGTAYVYGRQFVRGDFVVLMDADLSHHVYMRVQDNTFEKGVLLSQPKYILAMVEKQRATGCDIVTGSRYISQAGVLGWDSKRKLTSRGANLLAQLLLWPQCSDLTGSFRLYKRAAFDSILLEVGYAFQMEIIVRAEYQGFRIEEVPIVFVDRLYGKSKLGAHEVWGFFSGLTQLLASL